MYNVHYSCQILTKFEFSTDFQKILMSNFIEILPVGVELFHADRRTDLTKLIVAFRNFVNAPKKKRLSTI